MLDPVVTEGCDHCPFDEPAHMRFETLESVVSELVRSNPTSSSFVFVVGVPRIVGQKARRGVLKTG